MNKNFLSLLLVCFLSIATISNSFSQETESTPELLNSLARKMFEDVNNKDFDALLDMTHPKLFEIVPKESMKEVIKSMFEGNEEMSIKIDKEIPKYILTEVFSEDENNLEYALVSYDMKMNMTFNNQEFDDDSKKMMITIMNSKGMDVEFVSNKSIDVVINNSITILINDDTTGNKWVMLNYDPDSPLFYQVLPTTVLEKAKVYKQELMLESKKQKEN